MGPRHQATVRLPRRTGWKGLGNLQDQFNAVKDILGKVGEAFQKFWDKIQDLWNWVKDNWDLLLAIITGPFGLAVRYIIKNWDKILRFIKGVPGKIKKFLKGVWNVFTAGLRTAWAAVRRVWNTITAWVKGRPAQFRANLKLLWNIFVDKLKEMWNKVKAVWGFAAGSGGRPQFRQTLAHLWDVFKDKLQAAWDWVQNKWDDIKKAIGKWPGQIGDKLKNVFHGLGAGLADALNYVGGKLNGLIENLNDIVGKFGGPEISFRFPTNLVPTFAQGGPVLGPGGPTSDSVSTTSTCGPPARCGPWADTGTLSCCGRRHAAKDGLPQSGLFDAVVGAVKSVGDAMEKGVEYAIKYALGKLDDVLPDNIIGDIVGGVIRKAVDDFTGWGEDKDEKIAEEAVAGGGVHRSTHLPAHRGPVSRESAHGYNAIDIAVGLGTPILAASNGRVANLST